jgi:hypothetical protein
MKRVKAEIKLFFHLLFNLHQRFVCQVSPPYGNEKIIGCWQCNEVYWDSSPAAKSADGKE